MLHVGDVHPAAVRRLAAGDADALVALRREALEREPLAFGSAPEDDRMASVAAVRALLSDPEAHAVFGLPQGDRLVAMVGVLRPPRRKQCHRAELWGMYVAPAARGGGVGRALLEAAVAQARAWEGVVQLHLSVTSAASAAAALYRSAGFVAWGTEPRALAWNGDYADETHMVLRIR